MRCRRLFIFDKKLFMAYTKKIIQQRMIVDSSFIAWSIV